MNNKKDIIFYQELGINAWPPQKITLLNGWIVRINEGIFQRANSVLPLRYYGTNLVEDISRVEQLCKANNIPVIFQLPDFYEPIELWMILLERNYKIVAESKVMVGLIEEMSELPSNEAFSYDHTVETLDEWFDALQQFNNSPRDRIASAKRIIARIAQKKVFFLVKDGTDIVGVALGVIERNCLGIYNMAVDPEYRRKGIALSMIADMVAWSEKNAVTKIYLQVQGDNAKAIALYKKAVMKDCYHYRYFVKVESNPPKKE